MSTKKIKRLANVMAKEEKATGNTQKKYHNAELRLLSNGKKKKGKPRQTGKPANDPMRSERRKYHAIAPAVPKQSFNSIAYFNGNSRPTGGAMLGAKSMVATDAGQYNARILSAGTPWATAVMNGFTEGNIDSRYPDPFTLVRTSLLQVTSRFNHVPWPASSSESEYKYGLAGIVKGSGIGTFAISEHGFDNTTINWAVYDAVTNLKGLSWYNGGIASSAWMTRPNGLVLGIKPQLRGVSHSVSVFAVPVAAATIAEHTANPTGWPVYPNLGLTSAQVMWGGRSWTFTPEDEQIRLVCLPYDARSLDFTVASQERTALGGTSNQAWSEWLFWIYGLGADDIVEFTTYSLEEAFPRSNTTQVYSTPASFKTSSSVVRDMSINMLGKLATVGWQALKLSMAMAATAPTKVHGLFSMNWGAARMVEMLGSENSNFESIGPSSVEASSLSPADYPPPPKRVEEPPKHVEEDPPVERKEDKEDSGRRPRFRSDSYANVLAPPATTPRK